MQPEPVTSPGKCRVKEGSVNDLRMYNQSIKMEIGEVLIEETISSENKTVSFEIPSSYWSEFEESQAFVGLCQYLQDLGNKHNQKQLNEDKQ